jgi:hypothetical protein
MPGIFPLKRTPDYFIQDPVLIDLAPATLSGVEIAFDLLHPPNGHVGREKAVQSLLKGQDFQRALGLKMGHLSTRMGPCVSPSRPY